MTHGEKEATFKILTKHGINNEISKDILEDIDKYRDKRSLDCKYAILTGTMETKLSDSKIIINEDWVDVETPIKNPHTHTYKVCICHYNIDNNSGAITFTHSIKEPL